MSDAPHGPSELHGGRYVLLSPLGQGSQGTTWDAVDKRDGCAVAVKAFDVRGARAWKDVELAEREAAVLQELAHPALPRYIEHFEEDGVLYLVMEKMPGTPLSALRRAKKTMTEDEVVRLLRDADRVLNYLHGRIPPVIHRDLKPSNVILRPDGSFAFVDFGAVRDRLRPEGGSTVVGTFGYMAPEQFQGRAGPASDVYAMGATALAMLTGQEPESLPHKGLSLDVQAALGRRVSARLVGVLERMVEPDPDTRATRIGPLLERARDGREGPASRSEGGRVAGSARAHDAVRISRREDRARRRAERHARWEARRARGPFTLPFPLRLAFVLALSVAQVAVALALEVAVPLALTLLSIFFGRGLRRAAEHVRLAGDHVGEVLGAARDTVRGEWQAPPAPHVRVEPKVASQAPGRVRVEPPRADDEELHEDEETEKEARPRQSRG